MHQAKFSQNYQLIVQEGEGGCWIASLRGPCPARDDCISVIDLEDAKREAYTFADRHFMLNGIGESRVPRQELDWTSVPK